MSTVALTPNHAGLFCPVAATAANVSQDAALLDLSLSAGYGSTTTLHAVELQLHRGERLGVVGSSGAGKSTLAMALMGLLPWRGGWATGRLCFEGTDVLALPERERRMLRGRRIALVPQSPGTALNPCLSLQEHFNEVWRAHSSEARHDLDNRMRTLLERVDLPNTKEFLRRKPSQVSIGQAQRLLIALALLHRPHLLIADEPTSALDLCNQEETLRLLSELSRENDMGLLYISHDLVSVVQMCDRMLVLHEGAAVQTLHCDALVSGMDYHPVTRRLLQTLPVPAEVLRRHAP